MLAAIKRLGLPLLIVLVTVVCNLPGHQPENTNLLYTQAAQTIAVRLTQTAASKSASVSTPTATSQATATTIILYPTTVLPTPIPTLDNSLFPVYPTLIPDTPTPISQYPYYPNPYPETQIAPWPYYPYSGPGQQGVPWQGYANPYYQYGQPYGQQYGQPYGQPYGQQGGPWWYNPYPGTQIAPWPWPNFPTANPPQGARCDMARFVQDLSVKDGTVYQPGTQFIKGWRIRNVGTCTWSAGYKIAFLKGTQMTTQLSQSLPAVVAPGQSVDIGVAMVAPMVAGHYRSEWTLLNANSQAFGIGNNADQAVWVDINVASTIYSPTPYVPPNTPTPTNTLQFTPTSTNTPQPTSTPTPTNTGAPPANTATSTPWATIYPIPSQIIPPTLTTGP